MDEGPGTRGRTTDELDQGPGDLNVFSTRFPAQLAPNRRHGASPNDAPAATASSIHGIQPDGGPDSTYPADCARAARRSGSVALRPAGAGRDRRFRVAARAGISARQGMTVSPDRIVPHGEHQRCLFRWRSLLADPGERGAGAATELPAFEHLMRLDAIDARPHDPGIAGRGRSIPAASNARSVLVPRALRRWNPNKLTGSVITSDEPNWLAATCGANDVAIIADEVFIDYELEPGRAPPPAAWIARDEGLSFTLGGLSKSVGLPQVKLGWIAVGGPASLVSAALARLELICDTYLAVSTPVQHAAPRMLTGRRDGSASDCRSRSTQLRIAAGVGVRGSVVPALRADAGWYAVMQVPALESEGRILVVHLWPTTALSCIPATFSTFRVRCFASSSVSCRRAPISRMASTAFCGTSPAAQPDRDPFRTSPRRHSAAVVCLVRRAPVGALARSEMSRRSRSGCRRPASVCCSCLPLTDEMAPGQQSPRPRSARWQSIRSSSAVVRRARTSRRSAAKRRCRPPMRSASLRLCARRRTSGTSPAWRLEADRAHRSVRLFHGRRMAARIRARADVRAVRQRAGPGGWSRAPCFAPSTRTAASGRPRVARRPAASGSGRHRQRAARVGAARCASISTRNGSPRRGGRRARRSGA